MGMTIEDIIQGLKETNMICNSVFAYDRKKYIDGAIDRLSKYQMMQADYEAKITIDEIKKYCRANKLVILSQELYETLIAEHFMMTGNAPAGETEIPPTITATYNGYKGIAYGRSSYEIRDKDNTMVFHTGFLNNRPMTEDECLEELKSTLTFLEQLRQQDREE